MRRALTRLRWVALLVALTLLAAACGSTAHPGRTGSEGEIAFEQGQEDFDFAEDEMDLGFEDDMTLDEDFSGDTSSPAQASGGNAGAPATQSGAGQPPAGDTSSGGEAAPAAPSGEGSGTTASDAAASGPRPVAPGTKGVDDRRMHIAFAYTEDGAEANAAIGAAGVTQGDPRRQYQTMIDWVNAQGGVAGREVVPVWHRYQATSGQTWSSQDQAACTTYTQDNEVFASLAPGVAADDTFLSCMQNAGVPVLALSKLIDHDTMRRFPHFASLLSVSNDTIGRIWPDGLRQGDYFKPASAVDDVRVGLITYDRPEFRNPVERSLKPAMEAIGQSFTDEAFIQPDESINDVGRLSAELASAVLRFRQQGIQHVMIFDAPNALITILFLQAAENQGYRPRYGLTSNSGGQVMADLVPAGQLQNALSVSWNPTFDVPEGDFTDWAPVRALCDKIYEDANITFDNTNARMVGYLQCDQVRALATSIKASDGALGHGSLMQGVGRLGTSFESAAYVTTRLAPDRRFGLSRYRLAAYVNDCSCFRYTGNWRQMP